MESSTRNLMVLYGLVAFLSIVGVALNIIPIFNLEDVEDPNMTQAISKQLTRGLTIIAICYLIIALTALRAIIIVRYSKQLLIVLILILISIFAFGHYIFDFFPEG